MRVAGKHAFSVLIIVQNLPVPLDRRVWLECRALVHAGYSVSVICPQGPGDPEFEELEVSRCSSTRRRLIRREPWDTSRSSSTAGSRRQGSR